jgi:hypothetical protein
MGLDSVPRSTALVGVAALSLLLAVAGQRLARTGTATAPPGWGGHA